MKKFIEKVLMGLFVLLLMSHFSYAQNPPQKVNANYQFQSVGGDSSVRLSKSRAHNAVFIDTGMLWFNKSDLKIHWLYDRTHDTTFEGNALPDSTIIPGQGIALSHQGSNINLSSTNGWFNPVEYGAVGDGTTDNLSAFNNCIAAAVSSGGKGVHFYIPPGAFFLSGTVVFPSTISAYVTGAGSGSFGTNSLLNQTRIVMTSPTGTAFEFEGPSSQCRDIQFDNVNSNTSGSGILSTNILFQVYTCLFDGFFNGISCTQNDRTIIRDCYLGDQINHMIDLSNSVDGDEGDAIISGCNFDGATIPTVAALFQSNSGGTKISDCKMNSGATSLLNGFVISIDGSGNSTSDLSVSNCSLENFSGTGIEVVAYNSGVFNNISIAGGNISSFRGGNAILLESLSGGTLSGCSIVGINLSNNSVGATVTNVSSVKFSGVSNLSSTPYVITGTIPFIDNLISQSGSFSATVTATSSFVISIPTQLNNSYIVNLTPTTPGAVLSSFYISAKTTTSFTVTFSSPVTGSVGFDWNLSNY